MSSKGTAPQQQTNILTEIIATKPAHIEDLKRRYPVATLEPKISTRSLYDALKAPNAGFIFECKKASPSKGLIRTDFDIEAIADVYNNYATAISILTDEQFFQGSMDFISKAHARVSLPILCKDFFIDPYQIELAAHQGADAILLMLSVLDDELYLKLAATAKRYQLDILTEVSNQVELERAIALNAAIIGINNRNLRDLSVDLATTETLAPQIPSNRVIVSESGIHNQAQIRRLSQLVDGFLVGSSLMANDDLDLACRTLTLGHNKICGLTLSEDAQAAANAGAIYGGLIFAEKSPRYVTPEQALQLIENQRNSGKQLNFVGVFVNQSAKIIAQIAASLGLFAVQLHGNESTAYIDQLRSELQKAASPAQIWKAIAIDVDHAPLPTQINIPTNADRIIFDSKSREKDGMKFGGTGKSFDWQTALPHKTDAILAGGLNADNASVASQQGFYGLDFNSGLERTAGVKDHHKITAAFNALRQY